MITPYDSVVVRTVANLMVPFIQIFGLYVIFHGHDTPGGGFQGGAILGASIILLRLTAGRLTSSARYLPNSWGVRMGAIGVLIYAIIGSLPFLWGGNFLDYGRIPIPGFSVADTRALGILAVEIGVGVAVAGVMVSIFDDLTPKADPETSETT